MTPRLRTGSTSTFSLLLQTAIAAVTIASLGLAFPAQAQSSYPTRPIRVIVPFAAGGVADTTIRVVSETLGDKLGQRFIVENQPGAGGVAAARTVISSPADGYTLALLSNGTAVSVPLFKALPFDPVKNFDAISSIGFFDFVVGTNAESPYKTLPDLLKFARDNPGKLNVGTISVGSTQNLSAALLKSVAGVDIQIVPYRGTPEVIIGLLRKDIDVMIDNYASMKASMLDSKISAVATTGDTRSAVLKDVPTVAEGGVKGYDVVSWNALFAPAGTPPDVIAKLNAAIRDVLAMPDVKQKLLDLGIEARANSPEEMKAKLVDDIAKWTKVIDQAGIPKL